MCAATIVILRDTELKTMSVFGFVITYVHNPDYDLLIRLPFGPYK